jgi:hypothetical protein
MKRTVAVLWLLVTLAPIAYLFYFASFMASDPLDTQDFEEARAQFDFIFRLHLIVILASWALVASYVVYLFRTAHVPAEKRALWAVVLFLGNMLAMPFFWYLYVWRPLQAERAVA